MSLFAPKKKSLNHNIIWNGFWSPGSWVAFQDLSNELHSLTFVQIFDPMNLRGLIFLTHTASLNLVQMKLMKKKITYSLSRSFWRAISSLSLWSHSSESLHCKLLKYIFSTLHILLETCLKWSKWGDLSCSDAQELSVKLSTVSLNILRAPGAFVDGCRLRGSWEIGCRSVINVAHI